MPDAAGTGDLWKRTLRLGGCCDILIHVTLGPPRWRVTIRPHDLKRAPVDAAAERLVDAVGIAITRAEAAGMMPGQA
jgi:hypothetical protein